MKLFRKRLCRCLSRLIILAWGVLCASVCMFGEESSPLSALMTTANRMADPTPKAWSMPTISQIDECETGTYEGNLTLTPIQSGSIQPTGLPTSAGSDSGSDSENDSNACTYDADGRLIKDPSRGIANIVYNEIGMPQNVLFNSGAYIGYIYLANGKKVEQKTAPAPLTPGQFSRVVPVTTIYDEAFEISLGTVKRLNVPSGYVTPRDSVFHLYVPDYQGNNVAVINTETGLAEQLTDYYPYGQPINNGLGASVNPYKYGGKELLTANGYNASDFAARWLSHSLPGFQSPDPLAEKTPHFSMYAYCGGDPVNCIDSTGKDIVVLYTDKVATGHIAMLIQDANNQWGYYSINGNNLYVSGEFIGGRTFNEVGIGPFESPQHFMDSFLNQRQENGGSSNRSINNYAYGQGYIIKSSKEQDAVMRREFGRIARTEYNLTNNNCATTVQAVLRKAGIECETFSHWLKRTIRNLILPVLPNMYKIENGTIYDDIIIPKDTYNSIKEANPDGQEIRPKKDL